MRGGRRQARRGNDRRGGGEGGGGEGAQISPNRLPFHVGVAVAAVADMLNVLFSPANATPEG